MADAGNAVLQCDYTSKAGVERPIDAAGEPDGMQKIPLLQSHAQDWRQQSVQPA